MLCRYCQNLNYAQQLLQPVDPNKYTDYNCVLPVSRCLDILIAEALIYFVAAIYFDNVFADENGVRRKPWCAPLPLPRFYYVTWASCAALRMPCALPACLTKRL